jgi:hypothetical protein
MMRVDEQRSASAVAAEDFDQPAVLRLRQTAAAARSRQTGPQHAELTETGNDAIGNVRVAVDRRGFDLFAAEAFEFLDQRVARRVVRGGIGRQFVRKMQAEVQTSGEADPLQPVAKERFGFGHLFFAIGRLHDNWLSVVRSAKESARTVLVLRDGSVARPVRIRPARSGG